MLIKCKDCAKDIAKEVKQCPSCGSTKHRGFIKKHPILSFFITCFLIGTISNSLIDKEKIANQNKEINEQRKNEVQKELNSQNSKNIVTKQEEVIENKIKTIDNWTYSIDEDKMRGIKNVFVKTISTNTIQLGFPYNDSKLGIIIRKKDGETNVLLPVKGQFVCGYSEKCYVNVKFDEKPIVKYEFVEAANASSDTVFIKKEKEFINELKKSKKIIIEVPLFDKGNQQYEFNVDGLKWED